MATAGVLRSSTFDQLQRRLPRPAARRRRGRSRCRSGPPAIRRRRRGSPPRRRRRWPAPGFPPGTVPSSARIPAAPGLARGNLDRPFRGQPGDQRMSAVRPIRKAGPTSCVSGLAVPMAGSGRTTGTGIAAIRGRRIAPSAGAGADQDDARAVRPPPRPLSIRQPAKPPPAAVRIALSSHRLLSRCQQRFSVSIVAEKGALSSERQKSRQLFPGCQSLAVSQGVPQPTRPRAARLCAIHFHAEARALAGRPSCRRPIASGSLSTSSCSW